MPRHTAVLCCRVAHIYLALLLNTQRASCVCAMLLFCGMMLSHVFVRFGSARRESRLDELTALVTQKSPKANVLFKYGVDLRDVQATVRFMSAVEARAAESGQAVTLLVNNAGVGRSANLMDGATELWREMLEVNVLALCVVTREALKFLDPERGHIVHIGSMSGHRITGVGGMYAATKHAVTALTESLRRELREKESNIRV